VTDPAPATSRTGLADGEWHRLHPATPLLRGGIAFLAILGILVANLRERLVEILVPGFVCEPPGCESTDPIAELVERGYLLAIIGGLVGLVLVLLVFFWLSWRTHSFRITDEVVEVRSGILFRTHRKARLDRIQGVNVARPLLARIFGTAKLEVAVAGQDANVPLQYLGSAAADVLRGEILQLASGVQRQTAGAATAEPGGSLVERRVAELLAPELDPSLTTPESVVRMHPGRLIGSTVLSGTSVVFLLAGIAFTVLVSISAEFVFALFGMIPAALGLLSYLVNRILKFLRYSIAATPDGVRIGYGLLSTRNDTVPPGRVHSIQVSQHLFWRPADWWTVTVNRASRSSSQSSGDQGNSIVLPVGTRQDALRVLELLLPDLLLSPQGSGLLELLGPGLTGRGDDGFVTSPRRAAVFRWFSWRRNGVALLPEIVLLRTGAIWRRLVLVPTPRMQSAAVSQGPLERALDLAAVHVHTVAGPITARVGALGRADAEGFFRELAAVAVAAASSDRTHRWRAGESPA
jgi:putative membrane protein